jgi:hypothetical protein
MYNFIHIYNSNIKYASYAGQEKKIFFIIIIIILLLLESIKSIP